MQRYDIATTLKDKNGVRYYSTTLPPTVDKTDTDIYIITVYGDRLDLIAFDYLGDASKWWIISSANPDVIKYNGSLAVQPGLQLRIPQSSATVESIYQSQNADR